MSVDLAPLDGLRVLTSWRLDVPALIVIALLGSTYLFGVARLRRRGGRWPVWPVLAFTVLGLGSIAVLTMSSLGVYDQVLFWPRAVQNVSLLSVTPLLLALSEPLQLARLCLSGRSQRRLTAVLSSRAARIVCFPLVGAASGCVAPSCLSDGSARTSGKPVRWTVASTTLQTRNSRLTMTVRAARGRGGRQTLGRWLTDSFRSVIGASTPKRRRPTPGGTRPPCVRGEA